MGTLLADLRLVRLLKTSLGRAYRNQPAPSSLLGANTPCAGPRWRAERCPSRMLKTSSSRQALPASPWWTRFPPKSSGLWSGVLRQCFNGVVGVEAGQRSCGYASLHVLPYLTLRAWGRNTSKRVNQRLAKFKEGCLSMLVDELVADAHDMAAKRIARPQSASNLAPWERKRRSACREVSRGNVSKGNRHIVDDAELATVDEATIEELERKHPQRREQPIPSSLSASWHHAPSLEIKASTVKEALKNFKRGSAPGISGLSFDHLVTSHRSGATVRALTSFINTALEGGIDHNVAQVFGAARLLALRKRGGGLRPIAVGETLRRLVGKCVCLTLRKQLEQHFFPSQLGVGIKGGVEMVVHAVESILDDPATCEAILAVDLSNAFNEMERKPILEELQQHFPELLPFVSSLYAHPTPLILRAGVRFRTFWSVTGVQQGDPLGPVLFALAFHRVLRRVSSKVPSLTLLGAYLDDITIAGSPTDCRAAVEVISSEASAIGLRVNQAKSVGFSP